MRKSKCVFSVLLAVLLSVSLTIPVFASTGTGYADIEDRAPTSNGNGRVAGKVYTVTATTATGISKTFTLDTTDMEDHIQIFPDAEFYRTPEDLNGQPKTGFGMGYSHQAATSDKNPVLDTQCAIVPDGTKNFAGIGVAGRLDFVVIPDSVEYIQKICASNNYPSSGIYETIILYEGTEAQWNKIELSTLREDYRSTITNATVLFNCNYYDVAAGKAEANAEAEPAPAAEANSTIGGFVDVKAGDYCAEPVKWAVGQGITSGVTKTAFKPGDTCTQAQIVTFIWRSQGSPEPSGTAPYNISPDKYYYKAANWAYSKGMIDDYFNPNGGCSRATAMTYLYKLAGSPAVDPSSASAFYDVSRADSSYNAVCWAVEKNITQGTSASAFSPANTCTRGQIVTFLYRALVG